MTIDKLADWFKCVPDAGDSHRLQRDIEVQSDELVQDPRTNHSGTINPESTTP